MLYASKVRISALILMLLSLLPIQGALAADDGWVILGRTNVEAAVDFNGCTFGQYIPLEGGYIFHCSSYNYHYAYHPDFVLLGKGLERRYLIDGESFEGELLRGTASFTYVTNDFEGCDFDKTVQLDNGMKFVCSEYNYVYAYHPKVTIIGNQVSIGGTLFKGALYR